MAPFGSLRFARSVELDSVLVLSSFMGDNARAVERLLALWSLILAVKCLLAL